MKRFPELARRGVALALAASMSLSVFMPGALAASVTTAEEHDHDHDHVHLAAENSVDALGNEDLSDETYNVPGDTAFTAAGTAADPLGGDDEEEIDLDDLTEEQLAEQAVVDEAGHTEHTPDTDAEPVYEQPATCAERGYAIYPCSFELEQEDGTVAHCYHQVVVWLPLADHAWGEWQEPDDADSQKYRVCTVCNAVEYEDGTVVTPGGIPVTDPDQPEWLPGDIGVGGNYDDQIELAGRWDHTHNYGCSSEEELPYNTTVGQFGSWIQHPTCTSRGKVRKQCINPLPNGWACASTEERWTKKAPHTWPSDGTVEQASPCVDGWKVWRCTVCNTELRRIKIDAKPHQYGDAITIKPTCEKGGKTYQKCSACGYEHVLETTAQLGHHTGGEKWTKGDRSDVGWTVVPATCTTAGRRYRKCDTDGCGFVEEDEDYAKEHPATGHHTNGVKWTEGDKSNVGWGDVNQPYPCQPGTKTRECDICHEKETVTVPATKDHKYDEFVSTTQPYPCQPGTETWKCICGATTTKAAKVADHSYGVWYDDYEYGCQNQNQSHICLVCRYKETKEISEPARKHKYTHYTMSTPNRWVTLPVDISSLHLPEWAINGLTALGVKFDENKTHILVTDNLPTPIVRADCDYGCSAHDEINAVDYPKFAAQAFAATEASKSVAGAAVPLIQKALAETKAAVNNAQSREEAIAALDQIYNVARQKILDKGSVDVDVHLAVTGIWPANYPFIGGKQWTVKLYDGVINVPLSEEIVDPALSQLKAAIDDAKEMLNNSFLSEDAVKVAINKIVDTVAGDSDLEKSIRELSFYPIYKYLGKEIGGRGDNWPNQPTDSTPTETGELILRLADSLVKKDPNAETDAWQEFLNAIFDNLVDMLIEELKKDEEYSKYLNNALGDELLEELRPKLREELVNDTTFVDTIRDIASKAIENAAHGVKRGWSDERVLANLREDLLKVQGPVEQEMLDLSATIGNLVESSLAEKINKLLPFGDLTSWIGKWVGAFAKDKAVSEVVGETGKVRQTIEMYIKYITCGKHDPHTRIAQQASCTNNEMTERYCSKCGWVFEKYKTGDAWGHTPVTVKGYDATETADGLTDGVQCSVCGAWLEPQEVIPAQEPQYEKYLVKSAVTADTVKAAGYKNQKKLDEAIDAALTKAGYQTANSERFLAQVQTSIGILSNDRYPEDGVTGMVKLPAGAAGKNCTFYAVQVLTADTHGYSAGDVVVTPLTVTSEGISFKLPVQSVVAIAWKVNE